MKTLSLVVALSTVFATSCLKRAPNVPVSDVKVGNADPSNAYPAVFSFQPTASSTCSCTFVTRTHMLTAWHCIKHAGEGGVIFQGEKSLEVILPEARLWRDKLDSMHQDVAIVRFGKEIAPAVMPIGTRTPEPSEFVLVVGYGEAGFADDKYYGGEANFSAEKKDSSDGIKRVGIATIKDGPEKLVDLEGKPLQLDGVIVTRPDGAYLQPGDSGGALIQDGAIVGINSHGPSESEATGRYSFFVDLRSPVSQSLLAKLKGQYQEKTNVARSINDIKLEIAAAEVTTSPTAFCKCKRAESACIVYKPGDEKARAWMDVGSTGSCTQQLCNALADGEQGPLAQQLPLSFNNNPTLDVDACNRTATCVNYKCEE